MDKSNIIIDPEFQGLIPPLATEEQTQLEANLLHDGCLSPLVAWNGVLLDGHNRKAVCDKHGIPYDIRNIDMPDRDAALEWVIHNQFGRRNLTPFVRAELALKLEPVVARRARQNQALAGQNKLLQNSGEAPIKTENELAKLSGVSHDTIYKAKIIQSKAPDDVKDKLRRGESTINKEFTAITKAEHLEKAKASIAAQAKAGADRPIIVQSDAIAFLNTIADESVDLLITDPPYATDIEDITSFAASWVPLAMSKVKPTGRAYICTGNYPRELHAYLTVLDDIEGFEVGNVLVWTYRNTLGPSPKLDYKNNWQAVFHVRGPDAPPLNCPLMVEQFAVQDINAPDGRLGDRFHAWQKPDALAERIIRHSTTAGDSVVDCFAGTGTFLLAAARLGRKASGCDASAEMIAIACERGCAHE
jgi:16S rRNA G966 N2-methylase RsmD